MNQPAPPSRAALARFHGGLMTLHKFAVGQTVDLRPSPGERNIPSGRYKIQRQLPSETRDLQYRVKHAVDGHERVVLESQIVSIGQ
jgi:hypothetical protein